MKKRKLAALLLTFSLLLTGLVGCGESASPAVERIELNLSAAASLTDVVAEVGEAFEAQYPDIKLTINLESSGTLQAQIEEGAPADVFISAAQKQMNALKEKGLVQTDTLVDLLENKVVLIVPNGSELGLNSFEDVAADRVGLVGVGDTNVPAGQYAQQVFESLGIWEEVSAKGNFGNTVRAVLTWVETGDVDCGVVYATDAATTDAVTVICEAPAGSCKDIIYPAAVLTHAEHPEEAAVFVDFLSSDTAVSLFEAAGFAMCR